MEWRDALGDIIEILEYHRKGHLRYYACACSNGWKMTIKELYNTVKDYGITYEDILHLKDMYPLISHLLLR